MCVKFGVADLYEMPLSQWEFRESRRSEMRPSLKGVNDISPYFVHLAPDLDKIG